MAFAFPAIHQLRQTTMSTIATRPRARDDISRDPRGEARASRQRPCVSATAFAGSSIGARLTSCRRLSGTFNIVHNDPDETPPEEFRFDLCAATDRPIAPNEPAWSSS
jgi:hypothetical protein